MKLNVIEVITDSDEYALIGYRVHIGRPSFGLVYIELSSFTSWRDNRLGQAIALRKMTSEDARRLAKALILAADTLDVQPEDM